MAVRSTKVPSVQPVVCPRGVTVVRTLTVIKVSKELPPEDVSVRFIVLDQPPPPVEAIVITQFPVPLSEKDESSAVAGLSALSAQVIVLLPSDA